MIDTQELRKLNRRLQKIAKELKNADKETRVRTVMALAEGGLWLRREMLLSMRNTPRAPWSYKKGGVTQHPSLPGNPPAKDEGELDRSIWSDVKGLEMIAGVKGGAPYAIFLEEGTEKMDARPFVDPALELLGIPIAKNIEAAFVDPLFDAMSQGTRGF